MYPNTVALAQRIEKPIVVFDLEHTGGPGDGRAVTDFGALRVAPEGVVTSFSTLVRPPDGIVFNPIVCKLTGIYPETVAKAPGFRKVLDEFVLPNRDALWVGFNSRACDTPMVIKECRRLGLELEPFEQLDLMRLGNLQGSLSKRLQQVLPDFDTSGAHRGLKDALMTLALLEAQLPTISEMELRSHRVVRPEPKGRAPKPRLSEAVLSGRDAIEVDLSRFLVAPGTSRKGQPWLDDEVVWVCRQHREHKGIEELAALTGRNAFGVAWVLFREGLISEDVRNQYK